MNFDAYERRILAMIVACIIALWTTGGCDSMTSATPDDGVISGRLSLLDQSCANGTCARVWKDKETGCEFIAMSYGGTALIPGTCEELK